jgi:hypothetical protein
MARAPVSHTGDIAKAVTEKVTSSLKKTFVQMQQAIHKLQKGKGKGKSEAKGKSKGKAVKGKDKKGKGKGKGSKAEKGKDQKEKANATDPKVKEQKTPAKTEDDKGRMDMEIEHHKSTKEKINTSLEELMKDDAKMDVPPVAPKAKKSKEKSSSSSSIDSEEEGKIQKKHGLAPITKRQYGALRELTTDIHKALLADYKTGKQVNRNMLNGFIAKMAAVPLQ